MKKGQRKRSLEDTTKICIVCNVKIHKKPQYTYKVWDKMRFCSINCWGKHLSTKTPWNKGIKMWENKNPPMLGRRGIVCSDEKKEKISRANTGKKRTEEQVARIIESVRFFNDAQEQEIISRYINDKLNCSQIARDYGVSGGAIKNVLDKNNIKMERRYNEISKAEASSKFKEMYTNPIIRLETRIRAIDACNRDEVKNKMRLSRLGKPMSQETKDKISIEHIESFKNNPEKLLRNLRSLHITPNKPELKIIGIIKEMNLPYEYVGDGKKVIGILNPDFINEKDRKIIEVFGVYWHTTKANKYYKTEQGRISYFLDYNYKTLIIWDTEIRRDLKGVKDKILEFHNAH